MNDATTYPVIRRCDDCNMVCEPGCNCDRVTVDVAVDELTDAEIARFTAHGTAAQKAEIVAYLSPIPEEKPMTTKTAPVACPSASCPCSECLAARMPSACPEGCPCLVCLVDSLSANPRPRRIPDVIKPAA
jgi:hypothetical protein